MEAVGTALRLRQVPHALVDLDGLRQFWPAAKGDPFNLELQLANLTQVASTYVQRGARVLVVAGVLVHRRERDAHERALGCALTVVRLTAPHDLVRARLQARHQDDPEGLAWHLARFDELTTLLDEAGTENLTIDIGHGAPGLVAQRVMDRANL